MKTTIIVERIEQKQASILELKILLSSCLLLRSLYRTAIVHPYDGFIPSNNNDYTKIGKILASNSKYQLSLIYFNPLQGNASCILYYI